MYAVGHIALGHLVGRVFGKLTGEEVNIPLVWLLSVVPRASHRHVRVIV